MKYQSLQLVTGDPLVLVATSQAQGALTNDMLIDSSHEEAVPLDDATPGVHGSNAMRLLWLMLPGERPYRELHWLSLMPDANVTAVGVRRPPEDVGFISRPYRQLTQRFVQAGALAWLRGLDSISDDFDWVASLELCSLISGQAAHFARRRNARQAVLVWNNDPDHLLYKLPPYRQAFRRASRADLFLCLIQAAKDHCVDLGIPAERCVVVYPGIDTALFHPPTCPVEEPIAVFVSPLASNKGIDRVLEAFNVVLRRVPDAALWVVGQGPLEGLVRRRVADTNGVVRYLGPMDRNRVAETLRRAAVFVTAPRPTRVWNEQFGMAYIEAMAAGLPVVTTICGTNHEAVQEPNLLVRDDPNDLADALLTFLADPPLRARVGQANRRVVIARHDLNRQTEKMRDAFLLG